MISMKASKGAMQPTVYMVMAHMNLKNDQHGTITLRVHSDMHTFVVTNSSGYGSWRRTYNHYFTKSTIIFEKASLTKPGVLCLI